MERSSNQDGELKDQSNVSPISGKTGSREFGLNVIKHFLFRWIDWKVETGKAEIRPEKWFALIEGDFIKIFSTIFHDLDTMYAEENFHGCISAEHIRVGANLECRLLPAEPSSSSPPLPFEDGVWECDFPALRSIWTEILKIPLRDKDDFDIRKYCIPCDIVDLWSYLDGGVISSRQSVSVRFLIDIPSFWGEEHWVRFLDKFCYMKDQRWLDTDTIYSHVKGYDRAFKKWPDKFKKLRFLSDSYERHNRLNDQRVVTGNSLELDIIRYMWNVVRHLNQALRKAILGWQSVPRECIEKELRRISRHCNNIYQLVRRAIIDESQHGTKKASQYWLKVQEDLLSSRPQCSTDWIAMRLPHTPW